ncbi:MAG: DUF2793 domain-containing protein [Rickettsiales bacterium]
MEKNTPNLNLNLIKANQSQKEIDINEALISFDCVFSRHIKSFSLRTPPKEIEYGDVYAVPEDPEEGPWTKYPNHIALYFNGWRFFKLKEGFFTWVEDKKAIFCYAENYWLQLIQEANKTHS